jgi:hypothetical protein
MSKIFLASIFATFLCASLAAQAPQTPSPSSPRVAAPAAGADTQAPDPQSAAKSAAKADTITVEGCIQKGASGSATTGTTGTSGSAPSAFMLTSAEKPAGAPSSAPIASSYRLDAVDSKLSPHVGHKVEISGTLQPPTGSSPSSATASPTLKVDNVKMLAATCTN